MEEHGCMAVGYWIKRMLEKEMYIQCNLIFNF